MPDIVIALKNTPLWVYVLFLYLLFVSFQAHLPSKQHILKLALLPTVLVVLWAQTLIAAVGISMMTISVSALGVIIGATIGWTIVWQKRIVIDHDKPILEVPGNWHTLVCILLIFIVKYYYGFEYERDPTLITLTRLEFAAFFVMGICTGIFVGKFANFLYRLLVERTLNE